MTDTSIYGLHLFAGEDAVDVAKINENTQKVEQALAAGVKIAAGSYTGTGDYGNNHPNTLTFPFTPKIVFFGATDCDPYVWGTGGFGHGRYSTNSARSCSVTVDGNTMSWFNSDDERYQLNSESTTYQYVAIG